MDLVSTPGTSVRYKTTAKGLDIYFDAWPPASTNEAGTHRRPAFIYFHGGALAFGNRTNFTPSWLFERITGLGYIFISADYRLLPSSTGHEIQEDVEDLWKFIIDPDLVLNLPSSPGSDTTTPLKVDADSSIVVSGSSAGGFCAYLAAMHCKSPRPKAVLSIYGMGGEIFSSYYLAPKSEHFTFVGEWMEGPKNYYHPFEGTPFKEEADCPLVPGSDGLPQNNIRHVAAWMYLQDAIWLDYFTGEYDPSLSSALRKICGFEERVSPNLQTVALDPADEKTRQEATAAIPERHRNLFPQLNVTKDWPPTVFLHGTADTAVSVLESENLGRLLERVGVPVEVVKVPGMEHNFDFDFDVKKKWGKELDAAISFVEQHV
ncbi:hypothetical protein CC1G_03341 [Coprinopsis cinerea okayama7|uniref:Alpha/beta hydrolase fold-3 domain-containing protein n=1 Tax=Coprinopsis cinerea (strain Okayama-7 / 130 / ATCC MYA-4618 / FGSC 9003) TaxID=240176 RepID=A8NQW4_COPC7|nr:hypothetical protein CC1G_03341 [Coprinopsis cinerea okayama7\|eukprot:XP_001835559.1 hypothetical protein CC1G_03341 [Coprinopsis cinerea okayama7\